MRNNNNSVFQGWYQSIFAALLYLLISTPIQYGILSLLIPGMSLAGGWDGSIVSLSNSMLQGSIAISASIFSVLSKRFTIRKIMTGSAVLGIMSCIAMILFQKSPYVVMSLCIPLGACSCMTALIPTTILVNNWFDRNKSLPMAIVISSGGIGGFFVPFIFQKIYSSSGNAGCVIMTIGCMVASIIIIALLVIEKPSDIGEVRDGKVWVSKNPPKEQLNEMENGPIVRSVKDLLKNPNFYILSIVIISSRFVMSSVCGYAVLFANERNITNPALFISLFNLFGIAGRLSAGLKDKLNLKSKNMALGCIFLMIAGSAVITLFPNGKGMIIGTPFCGYGFGLMTSLSPLICGDYFGGESFTVAYGTIYTVAGIAAFAIPIITMLTYSLIGSYICAFILNIVIALLGYVLCLMLKKV